MHLKHQYIQYLTPLLLGIVLLFFTACSGCNGCKSGDEKWRHESEKAPYALVLSGRWQKTKPEELNKHADLELGRGPLRAIVIAQKLDPKSGFRQPTSKEVESASLAQMKSYVSDLVVEDEIEHMIGDDVATTFYSRGTVSGEDLFYSNTYVAKDGWIYQILCWSPLEHRDALTQASKELIAGWNGQLKTE